MTDTPTPLALVGCGGISEAHLNGFRALRQTGCRDVEYAACCDVNRDAAEKRAGQIGEIQDTKPRVFTDVNELIAAGAADAALLCLPHWLHHTVGCTLLEGGLHIMTEKPLAMTVRACRKLIETAAQHGRVLATGEHTRRAPGARSAAWALVEKKLIGEPLFAHVHTFRYGPLDFDQPMFKWRGVRLLAGGGMILDSGAHFADMMLCLFGEPDEVYCVMHTFDQRTITGVPILEKAQVNVDDTWHALIRFRNGVTVQYAYSHAVPCENNVFGRYYGTEGTLTDAWDWPIHALETGGHITRQDEATYTPQQIQEQYLAQLSAEERNRLFPFGCLDPFGVELWDFADAIRTGRPPELGGEDGLRATAFCHALYESATLGRPVKYVDVLNGAVREYQNPIDEYWGL